MAEPYKKHNSFSAAGGYDLASVKLSIKKKLQESFQGFELINQTAYSNMLEKAIAELEKASNQNDFQSDIFNSFDLFELDRLPKDLWARYLIYRYKYVVFPKTRQLDAFPPCIQIEPTSICNLRCKFCYQVDDKLSNKASGHMGQMTLDLFKSVVDQLEGNVEAITLASRGEPTLAKSFPDMMSYLKGKFIGLKINTNATRLKESIIESILDAEPSVLVFSMDSANKAEYESMRVNAKFNQVVENIKRAVDMKRSNFTNSRTILRVSGVNYEGNDLGYSSLEDCFGGSLDQIALVDMVPWIDPYNSELSGIQEPCSDLWRRMFIWWDGSVGVCDVDYLQSIKIGNVRNSGQTISQLWLSDQYTNLRASHLASARSGVCANCQVC